MSTFLKYICFMFFYVIISKIGLAQSPPVWQIANKEEVLSAYKTSYNWYITNTSYSFAIKYISFKSHVSSEPTETSNGLYKRNLKKYQTDVLGVKTFQNENARVIIDSADKVITVTNAGLLAPNMQSTDDMLTILQQVKSLKKKVHANKAITYRIDFNKNEIFEAYEFTVNSKGYLDKLVYFYSVQVEKEYGDGGNESDKETKINPRLEIVFTEYQSPIKEKSNEFNEKGILIDTGDKIVLTEKYKNYEVKDYRTNVKK